MALIVCLLGAIIVWQHRTIRQQQSALDAKSSAQQAQLDGGVVRASTEQTPPGGAASAAADAGMPIGEVKKDAKEHGAVIDSSFHGTARTSGKSETNKGSTATEPRREDAPRQDDPKLPDVAAPGEDKWGYTRQKQTLSVSEPLPGNSEAPFGTVSFEAWKSRPWSVSVLPRTYRIATVGAVAEDGRRYAYARFTVEVDGKSYPVPFEKAGYVEDRPDARFRWRMKPFLTADVAVGIANMSGEGVPVAGQVVPGFQLALAGYGVDPKLPAWQFMLLGIGYEAIGKAGVLSITPAAWNIASVIPVLDNLYVGPTVTLSAHGVVGVGGGFRVGL